LAYKEQKQKLINAISKGSTSVKIVAISDKIIGLSALIEEIQKKGNSGWNGFDHSQEQKIWFHSQLLKALKSWEHPFVEEYKKLIDQIKLI